MANMEDHDQTLVKSYINLDNTVSEQDPIVSFLDLQSQDLQCGQENLLHDESQSEAASQEIGSGWFNDSQEAVDSQVANISHDHLDKELYNLPRETFLQKLQQLTQGDEDTISRYRAELAKRAKSLDGCPTGMLISRKSTNRSTSAEKYSMDCYKLCQFLQGESSEIEDVFKKASSKSIDRGMSQNTPGKVYPGQQPRADELSLRAEVSEMRSSMASLKAEVLLLRETVKTNHTTLNSIAESMSKDIRLIKDDWEKCLEVRHPSGQADGAIVQQPFKSLSEKLCHLENGVLKLEKHRLSMVERVSTTDRRSVDNARGIEHLQDERTAGVCSVRNQVKSLSEVVEQIESTSHHHTKNVKDNERSIEAIRKKTVSCEKRLGDIDTTSFESSFGKFSDEVADKIDKLCRTVGSCMAMFHADKEREIPARKVLCTDNVHREVETPVAHTQIMFADPSVEHENERDTRTPKHWHTNNPPRQVERSMSYSSEAQEQNMEVESTDERGVFGNQSVVSINPDANYSNVPSAPISVVFQKDICPVTRKAQLNVPQSRFKGVVRRQVKKFYIGGIELDSDEDGLKDFLQENEIVCSSVRFFRSRRGDTNSAQIVIWKENAHWVEEEDFWPPGIICRPWVTYKELRNQRTTRQSEAEIEDYSE